MKVFVYGTLKRGFWNHYLLEKAKFLGNATLDGSHALLDAGFPVCVPMATGKAVVTGEVYEVTRAEARRLDRLEGNGRMYHRRRQKVTYATAEVGKAWVYIGDNNAFRYNRLGAQWYKGDRFEYDGKRKA